MSQVPDAEVRHNAILTENHAFVWASAGTGKTHTLTLRALYTMLRLGIPDLFIAGSRHERSQKAREVLQSVALMTFTRKAAAEMQTRLYRYLDLILRVDHQQELESSEEIARDPLFLHVLEEILGQLPEGSFNRLQAGAEALAERASEFQISTIHSFAAAILRRYPLAAGISPRTRFAREDEDDLSEFEDHLLERWWRSQAVEELRVRRSLARVFDQVSISEVSGWLRQVYRHRWLVETLDGMGQIGEEERRDILHTFRSFGSSLAAQRYARMKRIGEEILCAVGEDGQERVRWSRLANCLRGHRRYLFEERNQTVESLLANLSSGSQELLSDFSRVLSGVNAASLREEFAPIWKSWKDLIRGFADWVEKEAPGELQLITFDEMIRRASELLAEHPRVRFQERERYAALLVDEFQDTDPEQLQLLWRLLRNREEDETEILTFFVGDPKQSIYRFRGADVISIERFCEEFEERIRPRADKEEFQLSTSFRSLPAVTGFANQFFHRVFPLAREEEKLQPYHQRESVPPRWIVLGSGEENRLRAPEARELGARAVSRVIAELREEGYAYSDILVLTRHNRDLDILLTLLREEGVPVVASGAKTFYRQQEVLDVINLLIALHHPGDTVALAALLRSPLPRLPDEVIHRLFTEDRAEGLLFGDEPLPSFLPVEKRKVLERLRILRRERVDTFLVDWLQKIREALPFPAYTRPDDYEGRTWSRINRLLDLFAEECHYGTQPPLVWLIRQRDKGGQADRWDVELGEDVVLSDETLDAVRALTIHKAKGLEGRIVILYNWDSVIGQSSRSSSADDVLDLTMEGGSSLRGFQLNWGPLQLLSPRYEEALELDRVQEMEEDSRLAYVSATRAGDRLIVLQAEGWKSLPSSVREFLESSSSEATLQLDRWTEKDVSPPPGETASSHLVLPDSEIYHDFWTRKLEVGDAGRLFHYPSEEAAARESSSEFSPLEKALEIGLVIHTYLERYLTAGPFQESAFREVQSEVAEGLGREACGRAKRILERFFAGETLDARGKPLLDRVQEAQILGREVPFFLETEGRQWHGVIDLILKQGEKTIGIDYKTGRSHEPLPPAYVQQKKVYSAALSQAFPDQSIDFEFWWLRPLRKESSGWRQNRLPFS